LIQLCADCGTSVLFVLDPHKQNRLTSPNPSTVRHFKIASGGFDPGQTRHGALGRRSVLEQLDLVPTLRTHPARDRPPNSVGSIDIA